tara:strand:- start:892 stop:1401 length:510 start_codon:yes stop_codon:yes gene_type:complete
MALAIAAVIASVVSAGATIYSSKQAADAQEEQNEIQSAQQKLNDVSSARRKVKEARVARARLMQSSEAAGTSGSSGESGALSSLNTQLSGNLAVMTGQANTANALSAVRQDLSDSQFVTGTIGAVAGVAQSIFTQQAAKIPTASVDTSVQGSQASGYTGSAFSSWANKQ